MADENDRFMSGIRQLVILVLYPLWCLIKRRPASVGCVQKHSSDTIEPQIPRHLSRHASPSKSEELYNASFKTLNRMINDSNWTDLHSSLQNTDTCTLYYPVNDLDRDFLKLEFQYLEQIYRYGSGDDSSLVAMRAMAARTSYSSLSLMRIPFLQALSEMRKKEACNWKIVEAYLDESRQMSSYVREGRATGMLIHLEATHMERFPPSPGHENKKQWKQHIVDLDKMAIEHIRQEVDDEYRESAVRMIELHIVSIHLNTPLYNDPTWAVKQIKPGNPIENESDVQRYLADVGKSVVGSQSGRLSVQYDMMRADYQLCKGNFRAAHAMATTAHTNAVKNRLEREARNALVRVTHIVETFQESSQMLKKSVTCTED